jgi:hypothetical protein
VVQVKEEILPMTRDSDRELRRAAVFIAMALSSASVGCGDIPSYCLEGRVQDETTGQPLPSAAVYTEPGHSDTTDELGRFTLCFSADELPKTILLQVAKSRYATYQTSIFMDTSDTALGSIQLTPDESVAFGLVAKYYIAGKQSCIQNSCDCPYDISGFLFNDSIGQLALKYSGKCCSRSDYSGDAYSVAPDMTIEGNLVEYRCSCDCRGGLGCLELFEQGRMQPDAEPLFGACL